VIRRTQLPRLSRRLAAIAAAVPLALAGSALLPSPASAATCSGAGCNGLLAQETGCDLDARVIGSDVIQGIKFGGFFAPLLRVGPVYGEVQLWESPSCGTVWTTASQPAGSGLVLSTRLGQGTAPGTDVETVTRRSTEGTAVASAMWSPTPAAPTGRYAEGRANVRGVDRILGSPSPVGWIDVFR
jgi:hypothetical protein